MSKQSESSSAVVRSIVAVALISSAAAAALLIWARLPANRSRRLIHRCDDVLTELEHRSPDFEFAELQHSA